MEGILYSFSEDGGVIFAQDEKVTRAYIVTNAEHAESVIRQAHWHSPGMAAVLEHLRESKLTGPVSLPVEVLSGAPAVRLREMVGTVAEFSVEQVNEVRKVLNEFAVFRISRDLRTHPASSVSVIEQATPTW